MSKIGHVITPPRLAYLVLVAVVAFFVFATVKADGETYLPVLVAPPPDHDYPPMGWRAIRPDQLPGRPAACPDFNGPIDRNNCGVICFYIDEGIPDWAGTGGIPVGPEAVAPTPAPESGLLDPQFEISCMPFVFYLGE